MRCPALNELPPPPSGKTGWPWTVEPARVPAMRPHGSPWPRISIVTPSYNQGQFIEETIRSVLLQGYPDLEYIIIDGGSTDGTVDVIKTYEQWLTYWISEKDRGQSHAINKGFTKTSGQIGAYLNSDDFYLPGAVAYSAASFCRLDWDLLIGRRDFRYRPSWRWLRRSWWLLRIRFLPPPFLVGHDAHDIPQESTFWNLKKFRTARFDEDLHFCFDLEWYCRVARGAAIALSARKIGYFREHDASKTTNLQSLAQSESAMILARVKENGVNYAENQHILKRYSRELPLSFLSKVATGNAEFLYAHPL